MNKTTPLQRVKYYFVILLLLAACSNLSAFYSQHAYQQAVTLKVESLRLMEHATKPYKKYAKQVSLLQKKLQIAYQYALGRPNNETTARMWKILISPDHNLLGGFLARWKEKGTLSKVFIKENKKIIAEAFNDIIELESGKIKPTEVR